MEDSPRRSPRIASRASLERIGEAESPLSVRTLSRKHPRASTSAETVASLAAKTTSTTKFARRAHSVGGASLTSNVRKLGSYHRDDLTVPSRRNVPGPRKSAIRTLPPQVFLSPSELSPPNSARPLFSRKSLGLEAFGGSDLMKMMESIGILRSPRNSNIASPVNAKVQASMPRKSAPAAGPTPTMTDEADVEEDVSRKRRRVTFNPFQEKADFVKDEPTMRIRPASDADLMRAETSTSDTSASTTQSASDNSDMSLDTSSQDSNELEDDSSESEAEVEDHLGANDEGDVTQSNDADDTATMEMKDSAMDMTAAYGGMQSATMTGVASGFTADDTDSDSQSDLSSVSDDLSSNTMQLTEVHNARTSGSSVSHLSASFGVGMDSEMEVEEEDDVEKQLLESSSHVGEETSAMDLTAVLEEQRSPQRTNITLAAAARLSTSSTRSNKSPMSSSMVSVKTTAPSKQASTSLTRGSSSTPFSPRKSLASPTKDSKPLQARLAPNLRASRSPSPSLKVEETNSEVSLMANVRSHSPIRRPTLRQRESTSPRRGHEHCGKPAAESPKPRVSLATLRSQARRATSPCPRKSIALALRTSIGQVSSALSPEKLPFRSSVRQSDAVSPVKTVDVLTDNLQTTPERHSPASPARKSSSPVRPPNSPSRIWQSFREEQRSPTMPTSPARRISVAGRRSTVNSPQRIELTSRTSTLVKEKAAATEDEIDKIKGKVTMKMFFDSLNMGFLDLSLPHKRRVDCSATEGATSTAGQRMRASCVEIPALDSLLDACKELKESVDDGREVLVDLEREFHQTPPSYVAEVMAMETAQERSKAIASFKLQKSAARAIALRAYYGWRTDKQFDDSALQQLSLMREKVSRDTQTICQEAANVHDNTLPTLRQRRAALQFDVKRAQSRQKHIAEWDTEEMQAMHEAMIEQSSILQEQRAAHDETRIQLERLLARTREIEGRKQAAQEAIATAQASSSTIRGSTRAEASRLARFVDQLETLQQWSVTHVSAHRLHAHMEADTRSTIIVKMDIGRSGVVEEARIETDLVRQPSDVVRKLHALLAEYLQNDLRQHVDLRPANVVRRISTSWARLRQLFDHVARLQAHYPTELTLVDGDQTIEISSCVVLESVRAKTLVRARCAFETILDVRAALCPPSAVIVDRVYGQKDASAAMLARISDALLHHDSGVRDGFDLADSVYRAAKAIKSRSRM